MSNGGHTIARLLGDNLASACFDSKTRTTYLSTEATSDACGGVLTVLNTTASQPGPNSTGII